MSDISITKEQLFELMSSLPTFWRLNIALKRANDVKLLGDFYAYVLANKERSHSQLFQDLFVDFVFSGATGKRFLEFGATNGVELSNTLMLEQVRGWTGVLAEPDVQWHSQLKKNRTAASIVTDCIYSKTGETLEFISSSVGVFSSLKDFALEDSNGPLASNAEMRMKEYKEISVETISLNDVFEKYFNGNSIDYMSVDTEGSEYEILSSFDFEKYHPLVVTVEHNFSQVQQKLDSLFSSKGYVRVFRHQTEFDAWYVDISLAKERGFV